MRYDEFRDEIRTALRKSPRGLTWAELRERLHLPYDRPCPSWVKRMEGDIALSRAPGPTRDHVWTVGARRPRRRNGE
jgi:hypothetical protein